MPTEDQPAEETKPAARRRSNALPDAAVPNVHECLARAMALVKPVGKEGKNREQGYAFKKIDDFMTAANVAMAEAGIHQVPRVLQRITDESHLTSNKAIMRWVDLEVEFTFYGPAGDSVTAVTWGEGRDAADKATNKALTAAQKYALMYVLMVPTSDIQDADRESPEAQHGGQHDPAVAADTPKQLDGPHFAGKIRTFSAELGRKTDAEIKADYAEWAATKAVEGHPDRNLATAQVTALQAYAEHLMIVINDYRATEAQQAAEASQEPTPEEPQS